MSSLTLLPESPTVRPAEPVAPPTDVSALEPGLLLFFSRPSLLQSWAELFGHEWRHVGVTVRTPHGLRVASYGPRKCFRLDDPAEIMHHYNRVGVARVLSTEQVEDVERYCQRYEHLERADAPYTFSGVFVGPVHLYARRRRAGAMRTALLLLVYLYCMAQNVRYADRPAFACSTFVWDAVRFAREQPLRLPLSAHPDDEAAYATPSTQRDENFARWLCGPTELWRAIAPSSRADMDLSTIQHA